MIVNYVFEASLKGSLGIFEKNVRNAKALIKQAGGGNIIAILNHDLTDENKNRLKKLGITFHLIPRYKRLYKICNRTILWRLLPYINRIERANVYKTIFREIKQGLTYIRYSSADKFLLNAYNQLKTPCFFEINGMIFSELITGYGNDNSYFGKFNQVNEYKSLPQLISKANGIFCITNEIATFVSNYNLNTCVIGNSAEEVIYGVANREKKIIKFLFLIGADTYWQGINRLAISLKYLSEEQLDTFKVTIVGPKKLKNKYAKQFPKNVYFTEANTNIDLELLLQNHHVGITTLELYKKEMMEAAPLKTRDYLRAGMPIILGYNDTDVSGLDELIPFVYKVENNETILPFEEILKWARKINYESAEEIVKRQVTKYLNVEVKAKKIYQFLRKNAS